MNYADQFTSDSSTWPLPQEIIRSLQECQQNPRYHGEGNVEAHTSLVLEEVEKRWPVDSTDSFTKAVVKWGALLHDIGKPLVTRYEQGRWTAGGHEYAGVHLAREILLVHLSPYPELRSAILNLVRWHYIPFRWGREGRAGEDYLALGFKTDLAHIGYFSACDFYGRICEDQEKSIQIINRFQEEHAPKFRYYFGSYSEWKEKFYQADAQTQQAIRSAIQMRRFNWVEKLLNTIEIAQTNERIVEVTWALPSSGRTTWLQQHRPDTFHVNLKAFGLQTPVGERFEVDRKLVELIYHLKGWLRHHAHIVLEGEGYDSKLHEALTLALSRIPVKTKCILMEIDRNTWKDRLGITELSQTQKENYFHFMDPLPYVYGGITRVDLSVKP
jgi:putative nucleotidyltransferase with HDIG domain